MIKEYRLNDASIELKSDLAAENPFYLFQSADRKSLLYSTSLTELLADRRVKRPFSICEEGISFLLQNGVVPPPKTAYKDLYILGIGDTAKIESAHGRVRLDFRHEFPFLNANRFAMDKMDVNSDLILEMLAEATISRIDKTKPSFLFHSAGKDSNTIALALAEAGWQDKVTLITHQSKGEADESGISKSIAKKLGFKHKMLYEVDCLDSVHKQSIIDYFTFAPLPCTDNVTLAYPLYALQMPELRGANIIDGGGNDTYMATPPSSRDVKALYLAKLTSKFFFLRNLVNSESLLTPLLRTPAEWCSLSGFSEGDSRNIFPKNNSVYSYWAKESQTRDGWDIFDFKTDIFSTRTISEMHIRKARNFCDSIGSNLVLPFANQRVAEYFATMPESHLFDRHELKNKVVLRKILNDRIGLDSDALGKKGFNYDSRSLLLKNWSWITGEIYRCELWNKSGIKTILARMGKRMEGKGWGAAASSRLIYRLFLISAWFNYSNQLNKI